MKKLKNLLIKKLFSRRKKKAEEIENERKN